jgi:uncharacterized membrane protein YsdA (DUF1294 family)
MRRSAAPPKRPSRAPKPRGNAPARRWRRPRLPFPPIVGGFLLVGALLTAATAWLLVARLQFGALLAYVAGINLATLGAYLYDKSVAGASVGFWRVPEAVLHLLALAGGTPAALAGQQLLRHKTRKADFQLWFWVIVAVQAVAVIGWLWVAGRP